MNVSPCPVCCLPPDLKLQVNQQLSVGISSSEIASFLAGHQQPITQREITNHSRHRLADTATPRPQNEPLIEPILTSDITKADLDEALYQEALQQVERLRVMALETRSLRVETSLAAASNRLSRLANARQRRLIKIQLDVERDAKQYRDGLVRLSGLTASRIRQLENLRSVGLPVEIPTEKEAYIDGTPSAEILEKLHKAFNQL